MKPEEFRHLGHALIDWIAAYREHVGDLPVMSSAVPGEIRAALPSSPPETAESLDRITSDLDRIVMPGMTHWSHPRFFAYFPSNAGLSSVLADIVSTGLGAQGMSWVTSPAATELEIPFYAGMRLGVLTVMSVSVGGSAAQTEQVRATSVALQAHHPVHLSRLRDPVVLT